MEITFNYTKYTSKHPVRRWIINNFYKKIIEELNKIKYSSILDAGCGEGFTLDRLLKNYIGESLVGIDNSNAAINLGRRIFPYLDLRLADIYNLPFKNNSKDLVICTEVLEHLRDPQKALKEMIRVSRKYLILSVPNEPFFMLKNFAIGRNIMRFGNSKQHINLWTSWGFKKFVKQEMVEITKIKHPFPFTILFLQKI